MASSSHSGIKTEKNDNVGDTISRLMRDLDSHAEPVIDIIESNEKDTTASNEFNKVNDDELNDLVEEQIMVNRINEIETTRRNLEINRSHMNEGKPCINSSNQETAQDESDSLFNFVIANDSDNEQKRKEDLNKISKALTLNVIMQSELSKLEIFLVQKLKKNSLDQLETRREIRLMAYRTSKTSYDKSKICYIRYGIPYFKDEKKFSSPSNADVKKMKSLNQILSTNLIPSRMWRLKEKVLLEEGVRQCLIEENSKEWHEKEIQLKIDLQSNTSRANERKIKQGLAQIKCKMETLNKKKLSTLFSSSSKDREFDWSKISIDHVKSHSPTDCQRMWHLYVKPSVNKAKWTPKEDNRLRDLVEKYNKQDWDTIAKELGTSRTGYQCFVNYQTRLNKEIRKAGKWTEEENRLLCSLVAKCRVGCYIPWTKIAYFFGGRSMAQIYGHWYSSLNPDLKKGRFTRQEDRLIVNFVTKFGEDFTKISRMLGDRTSVQVRERYARAIPALYQNKGRWSLAEDKLLLSLVDKYGESNWSAVSKQFVTRTRTQVRHRYTAIKKIFDKCPDTRLENFHRGPKAQAQKTYTKNNSKTKTVKTPENHLLVDLIEKHQHEETLLRKQHNLLLTRIRAGRRKIFRRCEVDSKLINYFKETYTNDKLRLKTQYLKPDIDKAVNAMTIFCHFLLAHINLPHTESDVYKRIPLMLRNIVYKMKEQFTNWGCNCLVLKSSSQTCFCFCQKQNSIDCFPNDLRATLVDDSDYLLGSLVNITETYKEDKCKCFGKKGKHVLSYYLPPNIMTCIGFRSTLLIKDKIAASLKYDRKRSGYFTDYDKDIQTNGLKKFTGFFSDESGSSSDEEDATPTNTYDTKSDSDNNSDSIITARNSTASTSSYSKSNSSTDKNLITCSKQTLDNSLRSYYDDLLPGSEEPIKRLTEKEAINLWKERLMAVLGWPIVLSNQFPTFSSNFEPYLGKKATRTRSKEINLAREEPTNRSTQEKCADDISKSALPLELGLLNKNSVANDIRDNLNHGVKRKLDAINDEPSEKSDQMEHKLFANTVCSSSELPNDKVQCTVEIVTEEKETKKQLCDNASKRVKHTNNSDCSVNDISSSDFLIVNKVYKCYSRKKK